MFTCFIVFRNELCQVQLHLFLVLIEMKSEGEWLATYTAIQIYIYSHTDIQIYISVILEAALQFTLIASAK